MWRLPFHGGYWAWCLFSRSNQHKYHAVIRRTKYTVLPCRPQLSRHKSEDQKVPNQSLVRTLLNRDSFVRTSERILYDFHFHRVAIFYQYHQTQKLSQNASKRVRIFDARTRHISEGSSQFSVILAVYSMERCMAFLWIPHLHTTVSTGFFSCTLRLLLCKENTSNYWQRPAMVHSVDCNPLTATYCTILQRTSLVHKVTRTITMMIYVFRMTFEISRTEQFPLDFYNSMRDCRYHALIE